MSCFGEENHSTLRQSLTQAATRLVKRPDQVQTLLLCTHLFWSAKRVNESTQQSEEVSTKKQHFNDKYLINLFRFVMVKK